MKAFVGPSVVKGFNNLAAATGRPDRRGRHWVVFLSDDDGAAIGTVTELVKALGFAPVPLGRFAEGGALVHAGGALVHAGGALVHAQDRTWGSLIF